MFHVIQMMPANRWFAAYENGEEAYSVPLVCWALGEDPNESRYIQGMVIGEKGEVVPASSLPGFVGYDIESEEYDVVTDILN
jgi:hypothetical protein